VNSAGIEFAIERERIGALETDVDAFGQLFFRLALGHELLQHDRRVAQFQPTPADFAVGPVIPLALIRKPLEAGALDKRRHLGTLLHGFEGRRCGQEQARKGGERKTLASSAEASAGDFFPNAKPYDFYTRKI